MTSNENIYDWIDENFDELPEYMDLNDFINMFNDLQRGWVAYDYWVEQAEIETTEEIEFSD